MRIRSGIGRPPLLLLVVFAGLVLLLVVSACGGGDGSASEPEGAETLLDAGDPAPETEEPTPSPVEPEATGSEEPEFQSALVGRVIDGDTIELRNGTRVRLAQIDAPELDQLDCFSQDATTILSAVLPVGTRVKLEADPALDDKDGFDRLLRYVHKKDKNVNVVLVRRGAASVWFVEGERGRYAKKLEQTAKQARKQKRGLWGACPGTKYDPAKAVATSVPAASDGGQSDGCDPSYPDLCIPPPPPDLDCGDVEGSNFAVLAPDPHGFDGDSDGVGCER